VKEEQYKNGAECLKIHVSHFMFAMLMLKEALRRIKMISMAVSTVFRKMIAASKSLYT
jgi:hypothetical protein